MPRAGALAAALLFALALGTAGCELVSSLTPFGVGTQDYGDVTGVGTAEENLNGLWSGSTGNGGLLTFQVADNSVLAFIFYDVSEGCTLTFDLKALTELIANNQFTLEMNLTEGGHVLVTGAFTSFDAVSGTYVFEGLPAGTCPTAGNGTFSARKTAF